MSVLKEGKSVKSSKENDAALLEIARSWTELNYSLSSMTVNDVARLIYLETKGRNRWPVLRRALGRYNRLRLAIDLAELNRNLARGVVDA